MRWPDFDGALRTDEAAVRAAADDFGHLVSRRPAAVLEAASTEDVARLLRHAAEMGLHVSPRGRGGSFYGQAQVEGGVVVDLGRLNVLHRLEDGCATVDAGLSWRRLVEAALGRGAAPPVLPDYLDLSVGGTLAVGGVSGTSFRHGAQVDNVEELVVVTGEGQVVTCSEEEQAELFGAALAGLGQVGVIARATVRLIDAGPGVRVFRLAYPDPPTMTADLQQVAADGRFDYVLGILKRSPGGDLEVSIEAAAYGAEGGSDRRRLAGLHHVRGTALVEARTAPQWARRLDETVAELRSFGVWEYPHPWLALFVPASALDVLLPEVLASPVMHGVGPQRVLLYPLLTSRFGRPLLPLPEEEAGFLLAVLNHMAPGTGAAAVDANRVLFERNRGLGGTLYPISAVPLARGDWERHFGAAWPRLTEAKRRFDPAAVLTPRPGLF